MFSCAVQFLVAAEHREKIKLRLFVFLRQMKVKIERRDQRFGGKRNSRRILRSLAVAAFKTAKMLGQNIFGATL